jgi:hypothetical protein
MIPNESSHLIPNPQDNLQASASRGWMLHALAFFSCVVVVIAATILTLEIYHLLLVSYFHSSVVQISIELYSIVIAFSVIFTELEWTSLIRKTLIYHSWTVRGLYYVFFGLIVIYIHAGHPNGLLTTIVDRAGVAMVMSGIIFTVMGLLYLKKIRKLCRNMVCISNGMLLTNSHRRGR